ncbi:MAG: 3-methyl-2-oxobutanoate hydroxymethyltransferase [Methylacidiphilales bacterium]|nr:3-methyl-2-oxobutanoate hydroxymethyltransferase [Candidatus Methylacidiphilales bacterium]
MPQDRITWQAIRDQGLPLPILSVTAYDYPMARHLDEAGVDILHVGDSLGMVVLGLPDTIAVTMEDMIRHTGAVARARKRALVTSDLPYRSYETARDAVKNSKALIDAGADAVKMEGGEEILNQIAAVLGEGIPVQGHLGMLPQHVREEGGYHKKGKTLGEVARLKREALLLEQAGVFSIVLEAVVEDVAGEITQSLKIPTIGIASGKKTSGQIRVLQDVLGLTPWFDFPHVKPQAHLAEEVRRAIRALKAEIGKTASE